MRCSDSQVRRLMEEFSKSGKVGESALKAGLDRKTAAKYLKSKVLPSESSKPRTWRTRPDPFEEDWSEIEAMLEATPDLQAQTIFEDLLERHPDRYVPGQLRTLQRRVSKWRAMHGPEKEIFFSQQHRPGEAAQTDFTNGNKLRVTISGETFDHLLCHTVLPYSAWQSATVCHSESMAALRRGVQTALFKLGRVPEFHQTDHSTGATHRVGATEIEKRSGADDGDRDDRRRMPETRAFNSEYLELMKHFGMKPRTTAVGAKEQNGSVEALNGVLKRFIDQKLLVRGSRDFDNADAYERWVGALLDKKNRDRAEKVREDLEGMKVLRVDRMCEFTSTDVLVTQGSTIRVKRNTYSIPSRLIGKRVRVRIFEDRIEAYFGGELQLSTPRLLGEGRSRINYRHVIRSLVRKPGAFKRWRYREELFPTRTFREGYDALCARLDEHRADLEYLRILQLAAETLESEVECSLRTMIDEGTTPMSDAVRALVVVEKPSVPDLQAPKVDLCEYNSLISASSSEMLGVGMEIQA